MSQPSDPGEVVAALLAVFVMVPALVDDDIEVPVPLPCVASRVVGGPGRGVGARHRGAGRPSRRVGGVIPPHIRP